MLGIQISQLFDVTIIGISAEFGSSDSLFLISCQQSDALSESYRDRFALSIGYSQRLWIRQCRDKVIQKSILRAKVWSVEEAESSFLLEIAEAFQNAAKTDGGEPVYHHIRVHD
jgi:hypothetical protein